MTRIAPPAAGDIFLRRELRGVVLLAARTVLVVYSFLLLLVFVRWLPRWFQDQAAVASTAARTSGGDFPYTAVASAVIAVALVAGLAWMALAVLVFLRRSRDLFGLLLSASFLSFGVIFTGFRIIGMERSDPWGLWPLGVLLIANALSMPWVYVFPDGRFVPRWTIVLAAIWVGLSFVQFGSPSFAETAFGLCPECGRELGPPTELVLTILTVGLVASGVPSFIYRYFRTSTAAQRQQVKWVMFGGLVFTAVYFLLVPTGALVPPTAQPAIAFHVRTVHAAILSLAVIAIPVTLGIAIFRQGLLDIDLIINRTLTYAAVTALLAVGFLAISGLCNMALAAITGQQSEVVLLVSVLPVALAFMPMRARALAIADRFVSDRKVMTLLFVDLVGSTERAYSLGDHAWRELLERFRSTVRHSLKRHGGREIDTAGDGFFVTFEAPGRAVRCAQEIVESVRRLGLEVRAGVHIGEVEVDGKHVVGAAVHVASRVMSAAGAGEVFVSRALRDVLAGSEIDLTDRGIRQLKGVPDGVQLYAALA